MKHLKHDFGNWALLTGSTMGIGESIAEILAQQGIHLVTVARDANALQTQAQQLNQQYGIEVRPISLDLALPESINKLIELTSDLEIGIFIPNAAVIDAQHRFDETPTDFCKKMMQLNANSVMLLAHHFAAQMQKRGKGAILFVSSLSGLMPQPLLGLYGATKAFVFSLASSLYVELKPFGVHVCVLSPGPTRTLLLSNTGMRHESFGMPVAKPFSVAYAGLMGLSKRKFHVIPGIMNQLSVLTATLTPAVWAGPLINAIMRLGYKSPPKTW
jgi:uncharacterized protein